MLATVLATRCRLDSRLWILPSFGMSVPIPRAGAFNPSCRSPAESAVAAAWGAVRFVSAQTAAFWCPRTRSRAVPDCSHFRDDRSVFPFWHRLGDRQTLSHKATIALPWRFVVRHRRNPSPAHRTRQGSGSSNVGGKKASALRNLNPAVVRYGSMLSKKCS